MQPEPLLPPIQTNFLLYVSLLLCFLSALTILAFVIPLQIKQARVRNGLAKLRKHLLGMGVTLFTTTTIATYFLINVALRAYTTGTYVSTTSQVILFVFALGKAFTAFFGYRIYHGQYTPRTYC
jgi:hypothetical protein